MNQKTKLCFFVGAFKAANQLIFEVKTIQESNLSNEKPDDEEVSCSCLPLRNKVSEMVISMDEFPSSAKTSLSFTSSDYNLQVSQYLCIGVWDDSAYDHVYGDNEV